MSKNPRPLAKMTFEIINWTAILLLQLAIENLPFLLNDSSIYNNHITTVLITDNQPVVKLYLH